MKKGFISAGMIYTLLVVFLVLTFSTLNTMQNKKTILDNLKEETVNALYCNQNTIDELKIQIKELQNIIVEKNNEIEKLKNTGDASASQILKGKKALVKGKEVTGTMNNINGNISAKSVLVTSDLTKFQINTPGYYDTNDYLYVNNSLLATQIGLTASQILKGKTVLGISGTATSDANAAAGNILSGKTAYVNGSKITGSMANKSGMTIDSNTVIGTDASALITIPVSGYYDTNSKISVPVEVIKSNISSLNSSIAKVGTTVPAGYSKIIASNFYWSSGGGINNAKDKVQLKSVTNGTYEQTAGAEASDGIYNHGWAYRAYIITPIDKTKPVVLSFGGSDANSIIGVK